NFGPNAGAVSFVDPLTQQVRPLSVLVGSNGCGKTTVLDTIEGLLGLIGRPSRDICTEIRRTGHADISVEFSKDEQHQSVYDPPALVQFGQGPAEYMIFSDGKLEGPPALMQLLRISQWTREMEEGWYPVRGGLIYFPHHRWVEYEEKGSITEPSPARSWSFRFTPESGWTGSLSQLWVWQNYLDLEQGREGRPNLTPFVEAIETILGRGRRVVIRSGRVYIEQPGREPVQPHQLPSGEQQILTLFGEIIRHMRPGGVLIIDEVEISLHPALQRVVLHHLRELAARYDLQIILTTHSMEIVAAVAPDELVNLDDMVLQERAQSGGAS
ncbi:MAG TPA: ATP-binding protein, partial [Nannocystis sp.]